MKKRYSGFAILGASLLLLATSKVYANNTTKDLHGCYEAVRGYVESVAISQTQQLGKYQVVFKHENWKSLDEEEKSNTRKRFVADGPFLGSITDMNAGKIYLKHIMSDNDRQALLLSNNDIFTFSAPPESCNDLGGFIFSGTEHVSMVAGIGIFSGLDLQQEAFVEVEGTVNTCTGQNDFEVTGGQLCF